MRDKERIEIVVFRPSAVTKGTREADCRFGYGEDEW